MKSQNWDFMDTEFGNKDELVRDRLAYLRNYNHPKEVKSDSQKFHGMYRRFNKVYSDMEKVNSLNLLEHPASIQEFMKLLPVPCMEKYIVFCLAEKKKGTLDLEIVKSFMHEERQHQKEMQQLCGEGSGGGWTGHSTDAHPAPHPGRDKSKDQCKICLKLGHHAKECTKKKPASKSHSGQQVAVQPKEFCPFCKKEGYNEVHEYRPGTGSTRLSSCKAFRNAGAEERAAFVDEIKGCALCLCWKGNHRANNCPATAKGQPFEPCKENGCGKKHHRFLHGTKNAYVNLKSRNKAKKTANTESSPTSRPVSAVMTVDASEEVNNQPPTESELEIQDREGMNTMFLVQRIPVKGSSATKEALVFYDKGSNVSMIRDEMASKLGLKGRPVKQKLVRSGADVMDWDTKANNVPLIKKDGSKVIITAMGFPDISSEIEPADVGAAMNVFPQIPSIASIKRPSGKVDLLVGINCLKVQPKEIAREKNLSLWESDYGTGYLLGGTHPNIWLGKREALVPEALLVSHSN